MKRLIGDSRPSELYGVEIDQQEAVWWSKILTDKEVKIELGRQTKRLHGRYHTKTDSITLYTKGMNLGTLVHELAHQGHLDHQNGYKVYHQQLLDSRT